MAANPGETQAAAPTGSGASLGDRFLAGFGKTKV
jgi:hypothetical protein